jgi:hypothetical protein
MVVCPSDIVLPVPTTMDFAFGRAVRTAGAVATSEGGKLSPTRATLLSDPVTQAKEPGAEYQALSPRTYPCGKLLPLNWVSAAVDSGGRWWANHGGGKVSRLYVTEVVLFVGQRAVQLRWTLG